MIAEREIFDGMYTRKKVKPSVFFGVLGFGVYL